MTVEQNVRSVRSERRFEPRELIKRCPWSPDTTPGREQCAGTVSKTASTPIASITPLCGEDK